MELDGGTRLLLAKATFANSPNNRYHRMRVPPNMFLISLTYVFLFLFLLFPYFETLSSGRFCGKLVSTFLAPLVDLTTPKASKGDHCYSTNNKTLFTYFNKYEHRLSVDQHALLIPTTTKLCRNQALILGYGQWHTRDGRTRQGRTRQGRTPD